jgi:hypothetical protein
MKYGEERREKNIWGLIWGGCRAERDGGSVNNTSLGDKSCEKFFPESLKNMRGREYDTLMNSPHMLVPGVIHVGIRDPISHVCEAMLSEYS